MCSLRCTPSGCLAVPIHDNTLVNPRQQPYDGLPMGEVPWKQCDTGKDCIKLVANESNLVNFDVTFEVLGKFLVKDLHLCGNASLKFKAPSAIFSSYLQELCDRLTVSVLPYLAPPADKLTIFETNDILYHFNGGWLYNNRCDPQFRKQVDREIIALRMNGVVSLTALLSAHVSQTRSSLFILSSKCTQRSLVKFAFCGLISLTNSLFVATVKIRELIDSKISDGSCSELVKADIGPLIILVPCCLFVFPPLFGAIIVLFYRPKSKSLPGNILKDDSDNDTNLSNSVNESSTPKTLSDGTAAEEEAMDASNALGSRPATAV